MSPRELHHYDYVRDDWQVLSVPPSDAAPLTDDLVQQDWNVLVKRFVDDIIGNSSDFYPTFHDGLLAAEITRRVRTRAIAEFGCLRT